jgi:bacillolysin/thermolysin
VSSIPLSTTLSHWKEEQAAQPRFLDATAPFQNLDLTTVLFRELFGIESFDGQNSSLRIGILARPNGESTPVFNAYGGNGQILVGDGHNSRGFTMGDDPILLAHEFFHSFIGYFADLFYENEAGAIQEGLADFFAATLLETEVTEPEIMGSSIGENLRNILDPGDSGNPKYYGEYESRPYEQDRGGVHFNSTILSHALWSTDNHVSTMQLLLDFFRDVAMDPSTRIEEIALLVVQYCEVRQLSSCDPLLNLLSTHQLIHLANGSAH